MIGEKPGPTSLDGVVVEGEPRAGATRSWVTGRALVFVMPAVVCLLAGVDLYFGAPEVDSYIYVGAVSRLGDFLARWPDWYYQYRFSYLLPEWLFETTFGSTLGYLALRFVLLGLVGWSMLDTRRRAASVPIAVASTAIFSISPIVLRAVFNTYTPALGVLFLVLALAVMIPVRAPLNLRPGRALAGGALLAASWNATPMTLPISALVMAAVVLDALVEVRLKNLGRQVGVSLCMLAGTAAVMVSGTLIYGIGFGRWNVFGPLIDQARQPSADVFVEKSLDWLTWRHYLFVIPMSIGLGLVAFVSESDADTRRGIRRLTLVVTAMSVSFMVFQWGLKSPLLSLFYYSACILVPSWYLLCRSVGVVLSVHRSRVAVLAVGSFAVVLLGLSGGGAWNPGFPMVVAIMGLGGVVLAASLIDRQRLVGAMAVGLLVSGFVTTSSPHDFRLDPTTVRADPRYDDALFTDDERGRDRYDLARQYAESLPSVPERPGRLRVWWRVSAPAPVGSIQSAMVYTRSAMPGLDLPNLTPTDLTFLDLERPRFLVLMDNESAIVDQGLSALQDAGVPYQLESRRVLRAGELSIEVAVLIRTDDQWTNVPQG